MLQTQSSATLSVSAARYLKERGVLSERREDPSDRLKRQQTALMLGFRDTRRADLFEALYRLSFRQVRTFVSVTRRGSARALDPDDLTQEVFLNIYRYSSSFKEQSGGFRGWCLTIARNVISRKAREHLKRSMLPLAESCDPADSSADPRELSITHEEALTLRRAWRTYLLAYAAAYRELKPRDQEALRLVEVEDLQYREAALRLGVGLSNMKMILLRARRRIWRRMDAWGSSETRAAG
jgi:RNA polymerase sigma-70 factor (ECF subfamily)